MKSIKLSNGLLTTIDDNDYDIVSQYHWYAHKLRYTSYVRCDVWTHNKSKHLYMHRMILNAPVGAEVDHINFDGLDNRRCNLRLCNHQEQTRHTRRSQGTRGTSWSKSHNKWRAYIFYEKKQHFLGYFKERSDAIIAYQIAAIKQFGQFVPPLIYKVLKPALF